jgi:signal transduction histidine kinase
MSREDLLGFMENMDESLRILSRNLDRAAELIKSFKQIAVTQSHELLSKFRVLEYVQAVLVSLKHEYRHMSIRIDVACPEDLTVFSYPGALSQILTNLVMNSLIHGFRNRDAGVIRVTVADRGEVFEITYSDDGVGILPENLSRIYDPFFTTNREHGGSGLGMNIVYNIVTDQLKGTIECVSFPERGTTFVLRIPNGRNGENDGE